MTWPEKKRATNLKQMLEEVAAQYGSKTAIISGERKLSFADLDKAANRVANALLKMGIAKGDRVAMLLSNRPEFVILYFGITKIGAVVMPLETKLRFAELASFFAHCQPKVLITEDENLEPLTPILAELKSIKHLINIGSKHEGNFRSYDEMMATSSEAAVEMEPAAASTAQIAYTSSPAFDPRGAVLSHQDLVTSSALSAYGFRQTDKDIVPLFILPMFHMFGLVANVLAPIYKGNTMVIIPGTGLSLASMMADIEKVKGTMFFSVPYVYALMNEMAEKEGIKSDLSSLRLCISAGAPLRPDTIRRFKQNYGFELFDCWGMTETVCHVTCPPMDGERKFGSVGKALPGWEIKIVDDNDKELPTDQSGEIIVRGPMMKGYFNYPQATAETIRNGWLHTGDCGRLEDDGTLFITGRKKDMIIVKGQNIYPSDIETVLMNHPKVAEVAIIGIPDQLRGEIVGAVISLKPGEAAAESELKRFCLEHIASYKVPKEFMFLDSLLRTAKGKIDKEALRERLSIPPVFSETV